MIFLIRQKMDSQAIQGKWVYFFLHWACIAMLTSHKWQPSFHRSKCRCFQALAFEFSFYGDQKSSSLFQGHRMRVKFSVELKWWIGIPSSTAALLNSGRKTTRISIVVMRPELRQDLNKLCFYLSFLCQFQWFMFKVVSVVDWSVVEVLEWHSEEKIFDILFNFRVGINGTM